MPLGFIFLLIISISCEGREHTSSKLLQPNTDFTIEGSTRHKSRNDVYYVKLSPVPFDGEVISSPAVGIGTQFEVLLAPSAPSNNFILHPIQHGPANQHQTFTSDGPYYIDHQGNLVQRPNSMKPLNFQEAPPVFPHLTDDQLTMLGQPLASHHTQNGYHPNSESLEDVNEAVDLRPRPGTSPVISVGNSPFTTASSAYQLSPSPTLAPLQPFPSSQNQNGQSFLPQNEPVTTQHHQCTPQQPTLSHQNAQPLTQLPPTVTAKPSQALGPSYVQVSQPAHQLRPAASENIPSTNITGQPSLSINPIYKPRPTPVNIVPLSPKPPGGVYIATVNTRAGQPSTVFTCLQTHLLDQAVLESREYLPGPLGYSCKTSRGRPFLPNHLLSANSQSPVSQPTFSKDPKPLPIVTPINFL